MILRVPPAVFRYTRQLTHVVLWICILAGYWSLAWNIWLGYTAAERTFMLSGFLLCPLVFYLNSFWLTPWFRRRNMAFIYGVLLFFGLFILELNKAAIFELLKALLETDFNFVRFTNQFTNGPVSLGVVFSLGYSLIKFLNDYPKELERLRTEKTAMELAFLKSQIDPHFLFNTLNTLYALSLEENAQKTASGITKLGTLMRYSLHDSQAERIPLSKEIEYIERYIELQQLRFAGRGRLEFIRDPDERAAGRVLIAPMLFIPFIENAFKFSGGSAEEPFIRIELRLEGSSLSLDIRNSIAKSAGIQEKSGVGLQNVRNRLNLLYPGRHRLSCEARDGICHVYLQVETG